MKRTAIVLGASGVLALALAFGIAGCRSGSNVGPPVVSGPAPDAKASTLAKNANGRPEVKVLLDDPRLAAARTFERGKDWAAAAKALRDARPNDLSRLDACAWDYLEGRLSKEANQTAEAAMAFERAEDTQCPLAAYAKLRNAQVLGRANRGEEALAKARAVGDEIAEKDDAKLVVSDALASKGDRAGALPMWRQYLTASPYGARWVDTTLRLANALADNVENAPEPRLREAFDLATKVVVEAPKLADSSGATATRARIAVLIKAKEAGFVDALTDAERAKQAQAWLDNNEPQKAFELANAVLGAKPAQNPSNCKAAITRANAAGKLKPARPETWSEAVTVCEKEQDLATALYSGAKARSGKDPKLAIEWFAKIEQRFPAHRLADDARFRGALLVAQSADEGHEEKAEQMLRTLPDAYPAGDMRAEALFRAALTKMQKNDWDGVKVVLDRILEIAPDDRHWAAAGRADYFRARAAAATGDVEGARTRWISIVEKHPLTFYMLLAHARLAALDPAAAKKVLDDAAAKDRQGTFPTRVHAVFDSPGFIRGARLLEVGEIEAARREMTLAGAVSEGADPEITWTVGALYNQAGYPELGHAFARGKLSDHLPHYPEGQWRTRWEVAYPRAFEPIVIKACGTYSCPTTLAWGIMREESSFIADVKSHANAIGLMQLIEPTARGVAIGTQYGADEASLKRPEVSVEFGVKLLSMLRSRHGHPALAIAAYNGGGGAVNRWMKSRTTDELDVFVESIPYDETRNYVKRVLSSQAAYAYLYDPSALDEVLRLPIRLAR
jgi:soluble lytic murein transglycosylase